MRGYHAEIFVNAAQIDAQQGIVTLTGADAHHIARSLRMAAGETVTVCDAEREYDCVLEVFHDEREVIARITQSRPVTTEPPFRAHLYQALPKGDKLDSIIQKAVECGVSTVTPFESAHCIVRIKPDAEGKKTERRRRIALEAAKQCGRGSIPEISPSVTFAEALRMPQGPILPCFATRVREHSLCVPSFPPMPRSTPDRLCPRSR